MKTNNDAEAADFRGNELDRRIDAVLAEMLKEGMTASPISRTNVQKRLSLKSRSTLVGKRAVRINEAREKQLLQADLPPRRKGRADMEERLRLLQDEVIGLRSIKDSYVASLMEIVQHLQKEGLVVEDYLMPLRSSSIDEPECS